MADDQGIGLNNQLPWHISEDLKNFKKITMGKPILMGRKTFESLGRPLPGRANIVISARGFKFNGCRVYETIDCALKELAEEEEVMLIGGASLYEQMLEQVSQLYITKVKGVFEADTFFPKVNWEDWDLVEEEVFVKTADRPLEFAFQRYQKITR